MQSDFRKIRSGKTLLITCCILFVFLISCNDDNPPAISEQAENFLNEVLETMETNSINKKKIDWNDFRTKVFDKVQGAKTIEDTYPGIRQALEMLGDNHSSFLKSDGNGIFVGTIQCQTQTVSAPVLAVHIGYVKINSFSGSQSDATNFANNIQSQIKSQDHADIKGWIVDLRSNLGGNMWPMIAGAGPLLGEGIAGYFINADGVESSWSYSDGSSKADGNMITKVNEPYELLVPDPKVAVLLDNGIASSGEVMAISFIGRENTKSFGSPTCGLSTANSSYNLSGNCKLILTVADLADRDKKTYGFPINPDQTSNNQTIIQDAVEWLEN
jgi:hypothetical protein